MTDVQSPAARESAGDEGEVVFVKHKLFTYTVPVLDASGEPVVRKGRRGVEKAKVRTVHAQRFQAINLDDLPEDELARGEELGVFFTEEELAALRKPANGASEEEDTGGATEAPEELNFDDHDALVLWIKTQKPTIDAVVDAADDDPDKAEALLSAENEATGGQSRTTLVTRLQKIMEM